MRTLKVDVMQFVSIDKPPGRDITDLSVILPAVPQPAQHLHVVGGLFQKLLGQRGGAVGYQAAAEMCGGVASRRHLYPHPGTPGTHVVEGGDGLGDVERFGVGRDDGRHQPDVAGARGHSRCDENRVEAATHPVGPTVGPQGVVGLQRETVLDGDEADRSAFGLDDQVGPVAR